MHAQPFADDQRLFDIDQLAAHTGVPRQTPYRWRMERAGQRASNLSHTCATAGRTSTTRSQQDVDGLRPAGKSWRYGSWKLVVFGQADYATARMLVGYEVGLDLAAVMCPADHHWQPITKVFLDAPDIDIGRQLDRLELRCWVPNQEVHGGDTNPSPCSPRWSELVGFLPRRWDYTAAVAADNSGRRP